MKTRIVALLTIVVLVGTFLSYTQSASSNSSNPQMAVQRAVLGSSNERRGVICSLGAQRQTVMKESSLERENLLEAI